MVGEAFYASLSEIPALGFVLHLCYKVQVYDVDAIGCSPASCQAAAELLGTAYRNGHQKRRAPWAAPKTASSSTHTTLWRWTKSFVGGGGAGERGVFGTNGGEGSNVPQASGAGRDKGDGDSNGGKSSNGEASSGAPVRNQHHDHCLFMLRLAGENLFGMSHFLRVEVS